MKKTFIFGLMAATLVFTACSEDDLNGNNGASNSNQKGMVLRATVEQPGDTRATFTDKEGEEGTWLFDFTTDDQVSVTNTAISNFYTFTNDGTKFKSEEAKTTESDETWYAYFPSNEIDLTNQSGTKDDVANKYALAGATETATTGEEGLKITMSPKVAILVINNQKGTIDINVKSCATDWVSGLAANEDGFDVTTSTTKKTLLSATTTGTYYIAVPAGVQLAVKDGDKTIKSTNGLKAGEYYNLTIFPFGQGEAKATGIGNVRWIQLWENGPKFAEYNVGVTDGKAESYGGYYSWGGSEASNTKDANTGTEKLGSTEDTATKLWGSKWRMPTNAELDALVNNENCTCEWTNVGEVNGCKITGKGDYASNSIFLPAAGYYPRGILTDIGDMCYYWSSMPNTQQTSYAYRLECSSREQKTSNVGSRTAPTTIRPVLAE